MLGRSVFVLPVSVSKQNFLSAVKNKPALLLALSLALAAAPAQATTSGFSSLSDTTPFSGTYTTSAGTTTTGTIFTMTASTLTTAFNGPVGIGTPSPNLPLDLYANGETFHIRNSSDSYVYQGIWGTSYGAVGVWNARYGALPLVLQPAGGNVGIDTTSPQATLDIENGANTATMRFNSQPMHAFGGMYQTYICNPSGQHTEGSGGCRIANPNTGGCSCPTGYTPYHINDLDSPLHSSGCPQTYYESRGMVEWFCQQ